MSTTRRHPPRPALQQRKRRSTPWCIGSYMKSLHKCLLEWLKRTLSSTRLPTTGTDVAVDKVTKWSTRLAASQETLMVSSLRAIPLVSASRPLTMALISSSSCQVSCALFPTSPSLLLLPLKMPELSSQPYKIALFLELISSHQQCKLTTLNTPLLHFLTLISSGSLFKNSFLL